MDGEEAGGLSGEHAGLGVVADELDEGLGSLGAGVVAVIEHAEAVGAGHLQLGRAVVGREGHGVGGELGLGGVLVVVGVVPAEGDGAGLVGKGLQLVAGLEAGVGAQGAVGHHALEELESLDVVGAVGVVAAAVLSDEVVAVEVVDEGAGALVAALRAAVDDAGSGDIDGAGSGRVTDGRHGGYEIVGRPGAGLVVYVLEGVGGLKHLVVDGHAVGGEAQRVHVVGAVELADVADAVGDVGGGVVPQVVKGDEQALAGVGADEALGALKDDVGSLVRGDGGGQTLVAVLVVDGVDHDFNVRILLIEGRDDLVPRSGVGESADVERPHLDGDLFAGHVSAAGLGVAGGGSVLSAAGCQGEYHGEGKQHGKEFLHLLVSSSIFINFCLCKQTSLYEYYNFVSRLSI